MILMSLYDLVPYNVQCTVSHQNESPLHEAFMMKCGQLCQTCQHQYFVLTVVFYAIFNPRSLGRLPNSVFHCPPSSQNKVFSARADMLFFDSTVFGVCMFADLQSCQGRVSCKGLMVWILVKIYFKAKDGICAHTTHRTCTQRTDGLMDWPTGTERRETETETWR